MISVIVPLYNLGSLGDYCLKKCLDSLVNQTYKDFEVLLMENGSTDDTIAVAKEYCNKDNRFKLHILNIQGVSNARNEGIELAQGDYIAFIDGDDYISEDYLQAGYNFINTYPNISFISFSKSFYYLKTNQYKNIITIENDTVYKTNKKINTSVLGIVSKIVKKSIFTDNNIYFDNSLSSSEDMLLSCQLYIYSNMYAISQNGVYYYTQGRNNQTTSMKDNSKLLYYAENVFKVKSMLEDEFKKIIFYKRIYFILKVYYLKYLLVNLLH